MSRYPINGADLAVALSELGAALNRPRSNTNTDQAAMAWTLATVRMYLRHADEDPNDERAAANVVRARAALAAEQQWRGATL